jgi:hypothetical protein
MKNLLKHIVFLLFLLIATDAVAQQDLKIISPNGGEQLVVGTDVEIRWQGVPPQKLVILDYSTDNGQSWKRITDRATGLKHTWTVPNDASKQCLLRANLVNGVTPAEWARNAKGTMGEWNSDVKSVSYDANSNVYVCGFFLSKNIDFGNNIILQNSSGPLNRAENDMFIAKYDYNGNILWARSFGGFEGDEATSVSVDSLGNMYVGGFIGYEGGTTMPIDFGGDYKFYPFRHNSFFVAKFNTNGITQWVREIKGAHTDERNTSIKLTLDRQSNVIISGHSEGDSLDFGNNLVLKEKKYLSNIPFVAKYDSNGSILWAKSPFGFGSIWSVAADTNNNIYICGNYGKTLDFGNGVSLTTNSGDFFIAQYSPSGIALWARSAVGDEIEYATGITIDRFNNVYVCGGFTSANLDFGNQIILSEKLDHNENVLFLARYSTSGEIIWAHQTTGTTIGSDGGVYPYSIDTDYLGNIIIGGSFTAKFVDFGNSVTIMNTDQHLGKMPYWDVFLVKYSNNGNALWVKTAIDNGDDQETIYAVAVDPYGNIFAGGASTGFVPPILDFGNGNILNGGGAFVAKYDNEIPVGTQDISDNTWTINKPEFSALNIDMGKVLLGTQKDSVITAFIRNEGSLPVDVRDIQLSGPQASEFQIVTGRPPFIIPVNEVAAVQFRFTPAAIGMRQSTLTIITPIDIIQQNIQGEGVQPLIGIAASLVDMGVLEIGSQKDTILTAIVENIGNAPLKITNTTLTGEGKDAFTMNSFDPAFTLEAGEKRNIRLQFSPRTIGQASAQLQFEYDGMTSSPAIASITGFGIGGSMFIENDSAYAGESRFLKIHLNKLAAHTLQQQKPVRFKATVSYGNSIIAPALNTTGVTVANNNKTGTIEIVSDWNGTSTTLAAIPFTATLGDRTETALELLSFNWLNDAGEIINYETELQNGVFTMLGICQEGGTRLYDANGKAQMMMLAPHPANGIVEITFETVERGATKLMLTDVLGQQIVLKEGNFEKGSHSFEFDVSSLASGTYILTMQTPTQVFTQQVIVGK